MSNKKHKVPILILFCFILIESSAFSQPKPEVSKRFPIPKRIEATLTGLAWGKDVLYAIDSSSQIHTIDFEQGTFKALFKAEGNAVDGIAESNGKLWILNGSKKQIICYSNQGSVLEKIQAPVPPLEQKEWSYAGLAHDDKYLIIGVAAGWASTIYVVEPSSGEVVDEFFAGCFPHGLAAYKGVLWSLCYNMGKLPIKFDRRPLMNEKERAAERKFLATLDSREAIGLTFDGKEFWTVNIDTREIIRFTPVTEEGGK